MTLSSYRSTTLECGWPRLPVDGSSLNLIIEEPLPIEQLSGNQRFHSREIVHFLRPYDVKFYGEGYKDCNYAFGTIRDTEHICCKLASEQEVRTFEDLQAHDPGSHHVATLALPSHPLPTGDYLITMPLYGDDLTELADNETHLLAGSVLLKLARQLCTAVTFLHSHNMYHLDIKPQNLVVDVDNDCDLTLIDLGWVMRGKQPCAVDGATGTYDYAPPEVRLWFEWEEVFINTGKRGPKPPLYNPRKADAWMIGNLIGILLRRLAGHDDLQVESRHEILAFAEWIMNKRPRIDVALKRLDRIATNPGVSRTPSTIDSGVEVLP
ncbi:hypothetical protein V5O48_014201 [Marasmius crinis-equi]|uniref:Protein kinase domain-containing protein n=1 Tax=Marasmius crinis-equi TaxID=585013 RepID=A0ABR3EXY1_9AGAR